MRRRSYSSSAPLKLHHRHLPGPADSPQPPLVLVHGLFGSGTNFQTVAKRLASRRHVYLPDLRNHGNSPWDDSFGVVDMAEDLVRMLDDANVERYCDLLDEMSRTTQTRFILITHNPITMARMDRLFGVTMAERGVSQMVSVDLDTAERIREAG